MCSERSGPTPQLGCNEPVRAIHCLHGEKRWVCASAAPPLPKITLWRPGRAQLLPAFQAKCNARTAGMSAPFLIRPDTNQVCTTKHMHLQQWAEHAAQHQQLHLRDLRNSDHFTLLRIAIVDCVVSAFRRSINATKQTPMESARSGERG